MPATKIVIIGAGSASFGPAILGDLLKCRQLRGSTIALCDINAYGLELITRLAERLNREWEAGVTIESSTDRRDLLPGAEFVIVAIAVDRERCWRQDWEIPLKYGIRQPLGENGGPGALFHTARNALPILGICRDIEQLCPSAWLLNFTNPVPRMTLVAHRYSKVKTVGLCHQIGMGYAIVALVLGKDIGLKVELPKDPEDLDEQIGQEVYAALDIKAAGLNHFTFILDMRDRRTGEDLYPLFKRRLQEFRPIIQPLSQRIFEIFGLFPATGDGHLAEYVHWVHDPQTRPWEKYGLHVYDWDGAEAERKQMWQEIEQMVDGAPITNWVKEGSGELALPIILDILENRNALEVAVNIPNEGYISNLPDGAIVEVPAVVSRFGIRGLSVGPLPEPIAALCRTQITVASLAVDAAVTGSRELAIQALLLDPMVNDIDQARALLEEMLEVQRDYLPQFSR